MINWNGRELKRFQTLAERLNGYDNALDALQRRDFPTLRVTTDPVRRKNLHAVNIILDEVSFKKLQEIIVNHVTEQRAKAATEMKELGVNIDGSEPKLHVVGE